MKKTSIIDKINSKSRFKKLEDGWIRDTLLGLDWGQSSTERMNFKAAEKYCTEKGGRLPTIDELRLLIDYKQYRPAVNKDFFGDTKFDDWYWTASPYKPMSGCAWCVDFCDGCVGDGHEGYDLCVRPVRNSQVY